VGRSICDGNGDNLQPDEDAMSIRTILAAASGGTASEGAVDLGCRLARRFGAHIEGFHAKPDPFDLVRYDSGFGTSLSPAILEQFTADATATAAKTQTAFEAALARHDIPIAVRASNGLPGKVEASAEWHVETGYGPALVAARARFFDLVVLGRSERVVESPHSDAVEQALVQSGRPVLLAPAKPPADIGNSVALGWDGSAAAVHALTGALPFLAAARSTTVISVGEKHQNSAKAIVDYLGWQNVTAKHIHVPSIAGTGVGQQLLSAAREAGADLLAMGGYGRMPWREFLFGGATREVVESSLLPLLLTH
jgi:nucleotide-binding universal stress UspA family protein